MFLPDTRVVCGASGSRRSADAETMTMGHIERTLNHFGLNVDVRPEHVRIDDRHAPSYGELTAAKLEAMRMLATTEGLLLDPVYTASSMACLIDLCRTGQLEPGHNVVYLHTGGQAGLFPYREALTSWLEGKALPWSVPPWLPHASSVATAAGELT